MPTELGKEFYKSVLKPRHKKRVIVWVFCFFFLVPLSLHFIGAVILGAERRRDGHHHRRASVAEDVEIAVQEAFVVDDADYY